MLDSANWLLALLNAMAFILSVAFLAYVVMVLRPFLWHREIPLGDRSDFQWHIVIPCLDEETVIVDTVEHLVDTFPEATVWCVDDASADRTLVLMRWLETRYQQVRVISRVPPEAQQGKGAALNAAWRAISAEVGDEADRSKIIVGVVDADGRLEQFGPDVITGPSMFGDPGVGAVQVQVRITEDVDALAATDLDRLIGENARTKGDALLVRLQDLEFAGPIAAMQFLRRRTGSVAMGGNGQFTRLSVLDEIGDWKGAPWHGALLEDFELGLHVLLLGHRSEYCHDTFVAQDGLPKVRDLLRQRTRWAQGNLQCWKYLWQVLNSPKVPLSGALEIAHYMWVPLSQILGSVVFPLTAVVHLAYALGDPEGPEGWLLSGAWGLIPLAFLFGVLPHALWGLFYRSHCASLVSRRMALGMAAVNLFYGYLLQIAAWRAAYRVIRGNGRWDKTARAGDAVTATVREHPDRHPTATTRPQLQGGI
ncbi:glycosyltransferase family 2 protein [Mangrovihabitans endophyticus]|uniref:N-acetyl-glucosamine transferase n=1 Tax=Mangrovihabitans endophyticus TaxID=1751298 RepID=A0A8J3C6V3_9ACTN|nr:glycosyltransferase family 2 protein [Mangrovihabitans endophyticus]GGL15074.1 N-acetyl-glucosamine transferase [Mangrovihabitans endophyticus]